MKPTALLLLGLAALLPAAPAAAQDGPSAIVQPGSLQADRQAILAMAGTFRVRFDMRETTSWRGDYAPIPAATSGGHEVVRVIADTGRFISLQHMLVVSHDGATHVIKHWRQDWTYEPESVLVYAGQGRWRVEPIPAERRRGAWSQTVWQVDDSPRYGSYGRWTTTGGLRRWRSDWTWRPLARRDAIRGPRYDRYLAINRHQPTPDGGWIHWQDNEKMGLVEGNLSPFVQEIVLNTYAPFADFEFAAADRYWAATRDYWAAVRAEWARVERTRSGITITEEPQAGNVISGRLLEMGTDILEGRRRTPAAIAEAQRLIREATGTP
ncbi:MAG TPA: DUF6607 family protein [Allosphingosinicella sp.]|nr:DUF6607 family protein [Allosphingosinicella sp.]